jgi:lipoate-protein ligase A
MTAPTLLLTFHEAPQEPALNMAMDEALLLGAVARGLPVLRFYAWCLPAATFGYSQHLAEVEGQTLLRPLIRRPTGGGIVPHDRDWTYSLTVPPGHPWFERNARDSYRTMHEWIVRAFASLHITAELAPCCLPSSPGQCFVGHEQFDVLWGGRKIAGAAQRRNRHGLLIQGSVQPPSPLEQQRSSWERAMLHTAPPDSFSGFEPWLPSSDTVGTAESLRTSRYACPEFIGRR